MNEIVVLPEAKNQTAITLLRRSAQRQEDIVRAEFCAMLLPANTRLSAAVTAEASLRDDR